MKIKFRLAMFAFEADKISMTLTEKEESAPTMDSVLDKLSELSRLWRQTTELHSEIERLNDEEFDILNEKEPELQVIDSVKNVCCDVKEGLLILHNR